MATNAQAVRAKAKRSTVKPGKLPGAGAAAGIPETGRQRVVVENVTPQVDCGRFPAKRVVGDRVAVFADVFGDGHDLVRARLLFRRAGVAEWQTTEMQPMGNDRWMGAFVVEEVGAYEFTVAGQEDHFASWRSDLRKRIAAAQELGLPFRNGAVLVRRAAARTEGSDAKALLAFAKRLEAKIPDEAVAFDEELLAMINRHPDDALETRYERVLPLWVDRERARFSSWYELFPRSWGKPGEHGTFRDVAGQLPYVQQMGFNVLYLPPIHPIGVPFRKGKNNTTEAQPDDVGSPWAIGGGPTGGHKAILPELGTFADFDYLLEQCTSHGLELALDIAFQCAPDHPWVTEHPEWFLKRADGSIQYAENPPKKYQDIYPLDFESSDWQGLWQELKSVFVFWAERGVRIFRVDNPHTKAFPFWEWCLAEVKRLYPDVIFLAEAFTRPRVMERLAKLGYTQSYTYFTWRTTKTELTEYMRELTETSVREYLRPNFWPNTPDILPLGLQSGGEPAFKSRLVLAATLAANYGIYGPAYELTENLPYKEGGEEYLRSEKYEIKQWDRSNGDAIRELITRLNQARRAHRALQSNEGLRFHTTDNEMLIAYSKLAAREEPGGETADAVLTVVNLDPGNVQSGWVDVDPAAVGLPGGASFEVFDLLSDTSYAWGAGRNYVELRPREMPAHVFQIRERI